LPAQLQEKYTTAFGLSAYDAAQICVDKEDALLFENIATKTANYKSIANWIIGPVRNYCNEQQIGLNDFPLSANVLAALIQFTDTGKVHFNVASTKLMDALIVDKTASVESLAASMNLIQESDTGALGIWVDEAIAAMPDKVKEYKAGKKGLIGLFAGHVKKLSKGKADMGAVTKMLEEKLD
jgi:aspartyl-tRNA(Asn)/glutamyl-tRNA(Gln) amidotransferase subunit B